MRVSDFHFDLPDELIAQHPPAERGASRMLVFDRGQLPGTRGQEEQNVQQQAWLRDATFRDLPEFLRAGDLLVLNDSKVLPARLFAKRAVATGQIEVLLTEEVSEEAGKRERGIGLVWRALVRPGRKVRVGERLEFWGAEQAEAPGLKPLTSEVVDRGLKSAANPGDAPVLTAEVVGAGAFGERTLRFAPVEDFYGVVGRIGHMPLPPYIRHRRDEAEDRERYQTVYAREKGSAAAPTAGLHFTEEVLEALRVKGVEIAYVTLHVGLGTFQPVRVEELKDIRLHAERYTLPAATAEALNRAMGEGRRVVAVGTTTTRVLEHIAAEAEGPVSGLKPENGKGSGRGAEAPSSLGFEAHSGETSMFIGPGHKFKVVRRLLTNFHLPESTLLMLVSAFAGDGEDKLDAGRRKVLEAYAHAVREGYRFYSYGDCMLLL